jgi:hypothetical protein
MLPFALLAATASSNFQSEDPTLSPGSSEDFQATGTFGSSATGLETPEPCTTLPFTDGPSGPSAGLIVALVLTVVLAVAIAVGFRVACRRRGRARPAGSEQINEHASDPLLVPDSFF